MPDRLVGVAEDVVLNPHDIFDGGNRVDPAVNHGQDIRERTLNRGIVLVSVATVLSESAAVGRLPLPPNPVNGSVVQEANGILIFSN